MIVRCVAGVIEVQVFSSHVDDDFFYIHVDDFSSHLAERIFLHILYIYFIIEMFTYFDLCCIYFMNERN